MNTGRTNVPCQDCSYPRTTILPPSGYVSVKDAREWEERLMGYTDALEHAAVYVQEHCVDGEEHAAAIRGMRRPDDLSRLRENGAKAWAGVDPQELRDGGKE